MTAAYATRIEVLECPRCNGVGRIAAFKHVEDGLCFECSGTKVVEREVSDEPAATPARTAVPEPRLWTASKAIELPTLGAAEVRRWHDGSFRLITVSRVSGELTTRFRVIRGRVVIDETCNGHIEPFEVLEDGILDAVIVNGRLGLRAELQAALRR